MPRPTKTKDGLRECNLCKITKPLSEYTKNGKYYRGECKSCRALELKELREWINSFKQTACADCGKQYPASIMDFDHVSGDKLGKVSSFLSKERILKEIEKCDVVCALCHRIRTVNRLGLLSEEDLDVISKLQTY